MRALIRDSSGGVTAYSAVFMAIAIGVGALAVDFGRMAVLKSQIQDRADAGAMAGAAHLDGRTGAQSRARNVATNAALQTSALTSDGPQLSVASVNFYSQITPNRVAAIDDGDSAFIEVVMQPKTVSFLFQPVLELMTGTNDAGSRQIGSSAVAAMSPFICNAPPLMMCDPAEADPALAVDLAQNIGMQYRLKEAQAGGTPWSPGNFGLLSLPDGSSGASAIQGALAAVQPTGCYKLDVITATGSKTNMVKDGINSRFDLDGMPDPAPNVIAYPRDDVIIADPDLNFGDGVWDAVTYWTDKHGAGGVPADLTADPINDSTSRYQSYLYELGLEFARNGRQTLYPAPAPADMPAGYALVTPAAKDLPKAADPAKSSNPHFDGVPSVPAASNGYARRLVQVAVLKCVADGINGKGTYPTDGNFVEIFITEPVNDPPDAAIYGELVRPLSPVNSPQYFANVRLVE